MVVTWVQQKLWWWLVLVPRGLALLALKAFWPTRLGRYVYNLFPVLKVVARSFPAIDKAYRVAERG